MRILTALALAHLAAALYAPLHASEEQSSQAAAPWGPKDWGVLVVGGPGSPQGGKPVAALRDGLKGKFPLEFAFGLADPREIQKGIDRLTARRVKKIVVVPLALSSQSDAMEETKYVLGLRKEPSAEFFKAGRNRSGYTTIKRVQTKLPVVMASALDEHPFLAEILAARAKELSERPAKERVLIVGRGSAAAADHELAQRQLAALARKVKALGGFAGAEALLLRDDAPEKARAQARAAMRKAVSAWSREGRVIVVPHLLTPDGFEREVRKTLDGVFHKWSGKTLLPDPRLSDWVEAKAREAADMPDMRLYKDAGRPIPPPERKRLLRLETEGYPDARAPRFSKPQAAAPPPAEPKLPEGEADAAAPARPSSADETAPADDEKQDQDPPQETPPAGGDPPRRGASE